MKHEFACHHWASTDYAFCIKCFKCYYIPDGLVWNETNPSCCGYANSVVSKHFEKEFESTGKISSFFFPNPYDDNLSTHGFIVTSLF